ARLPRTRGVRNAYGFGGGTTSPRCPARPPSPSRPGFRSCGSTSTASARASGLVDVPELLERADFPRRTLQAALRRPGDLGNVDVSPRVDDHAVGRREVARLLARELPPEARHALALGVEHGDARADVGRVVGHRDR